MSAARPDGLSIALAFRPPEAGAFCSGFSPKTMGKFTARKLSSGSAKCSVASPNTDAIIRIGEFFLARFNLRESWNAWRCLC